MCDQILLLHLGPSCKDFSGTIFWRQGNLSLIWGFSFHFPAPYNRTNCFESDVLARSVVCYMGSEWLQDHGWAFLQMMTKYMDSPRNVFSLGQHCYIAGLLPYEEACQLVQIIKERLGSWYDCTKTNDQKHQTLWTNSLSVLSSYWKLLTWNSTWIENKYLS